MTADQFSRSLGLLGMSLLGTGLAHAALQGRDLDGNSANGYEAYYDTVQNLTWMADANYAKTAALAGAAPNGTMTLAAGESAGASLNYFGVSGWRLPTVGRSDGTNVSGTLLGFDGSTRRGYNIVDPRSEMSYMFHVNLGLAGQFDTSGVQRPGFAPHGTGDVAIPGLEGAFIRNLQAFDGTSSARYLTSTPSGLSGWNFDFEFDKGAQELFSLGSGRFSNSTHVWFVRDGDVVAAIPEPATAGLMGLGLAGLAWSVRRPGASRP